jgi:glycosyltransferase involved in cell wall biosynthesis
VISRPTRVALIHNIITPHVLHLYERLAAEPGVRLKVYFLAETDKNRHWDTAIGQKFEFQLLPNWALRLQGADLFTYFINPTLPAVLLRDPFDVVIVDGWDSFASIAAFAVAKLHHKAYVVWSGSTTNEPSWRRTLSRPLVRLLVRRADGCIAYGTRAREYLIQLGAHPGKISIAFNTVDIEWFQAKAKELRPMRERIRADLRLGSGPVIVYVGQLIERKGVLDLLDAYQILAKRRPDTQLMLVGTGRLEAALRQRVSDQHLRGVRFAGHVRIADLPRYYAAADCFTLPSHEEVWGLVLNEAAASGLPLVTTWPVGAAVDLIEEGVNGGVVRSHCPVDLARALDEAIDHRIEWGRASRRIVQRATFAQNVQAVVGLLRNLHDRAMAAA